jgi:hypothetical protein
MHHLEQEACATGNLAAGATFCMTACKMLPLHASGLFCFEERS